MRAHFTVEENGVNIQLGAAETVIGREVCRLSDPKCAECGAFFSCRARTRPRARRVSRKQVRVQLNPVTEDVVVFSMVRAQSPESFVVGVRPTPPHLRVR